MPGQPHRNTPIRRTLPKYLPELYESGNFAVLHRHLITTPVDEQYTKPAHCINFGKSSNMSFEIVPRNSLVPVSEQDAGSLLSRLSLKGKTAVITGAGAGIGLSVAYGYAEFGANLALWYYKNQQTPERAQEIASKYGVKCIAIQVDIRKHDQVEKAMRESVEKLNGRLDIVVANAGIPWTRGEILAAEDPLGHYAAVMQTNVDGVFYTSMEAAKYWTRQKKEGTDLAGKPLNFKLGSLIATASMSGSIVNIPQRQSVYNSSKAAVIHMIKSLAVEWAGIARANTVSPGYMLTEISNFVPQETHDLWQTKTPQGYVHLPCPAMLTVLDARVSLMNYRAHTCILLRMLRHIQRALIWLLTEVTVCHKFAKGSTFTCNDHKYYKFITVGPMSIC